MSIYTDMQSLIKRAIETQLIHQRDEIYVRNQIMHALHLESFPDDIVSKQAETIPCLLEKLIDYAVAQGIIDDVFDDREILGAKIMDYFVPLPSVVEQQFYENYKVSPQQATDYFYQLSQNSNYIQTERIAKNIHFQSESVFGAMDITINLSKPEKDPEQIKRERAQKQVLDYPSCVLCHENEGYVGRIGYPARANHRVIQVPLQEEKWYLQYSPYLYYNEHSILLSKEHRPMQINTNTFSRLLAFVEKFPHYFIGSNADLPVVGGSILSHDHYQAGRYEFAMTHAPDDESFQMENFPGVTISILRWPMSVLRLRSKDKDMLTQTAGYILETWKQYDDPAHNIISATNGTPHNTITPIARKNEETFELDLVLRNNRTTETHPMGLFHPHEDVHHIKKENIGLIEVMGLAVLPARLASELKEIENFLLGKTNTVADYHLEWAKTLKDQHGTIKQEEEAKQIVQEALGHKFSRVLADAGVFKRTTTGKKAFQQFTQTLTKGD